MKKRIMNKIVAVTLILSLTMANVMLVATESYAMYEELESQKIVSNNKNIEFDTYFKVGEERKHSVSKEIGNEEIIYFNIKVKEGYLKNATIALENPNFIMQEIVSENKGMVNKISENQIIISQINSNQEIEIGVKVKFKEETKIDLDYLNKEITAKCEGEYVSIKGKESKVDGEIKVRIEWNSNNESEIEENIEKALVENNKTIIQMDIKTGIKDSILPVKTTKIEMQIEAIENKMPDEIRVVAESTIGTNGKTYIDGAEIGEVSYNKETGKVEIEVKNEQDAEGKITWKKGKDNYKIIMIYGEEIAEKQIKGKIESTIETYNGKQIKSEKEIAEEIKEKGNNVKVEIKSSEEINKGNIYANSKYETEYESRWIAEITYKDSAKEVTIEQDTDKFILENEKEEEANTIYKSTKISKVNFEKMLGQEGKIEIYSNEEKIGEININSTVDEKGYLEYKYEKEINNIKIVTTQVKSEGKIEIINEKAIKAQSNKSFEEMKQIKAIKSNVKGKTQTEQIQEESSTTQMKETSTKGTIKIENENLSTVVKNENVEIRAILEANDSTDDLYKNAKIEIELPEQIEEINIKSADILFSDEIIIKSVDIYTNAEGRKVVRIITQGEQTQYITDGNNGINIIINTDIILNKTASNEETKMKMKVENEKAVRVENEGIFETKVNVVAPTGVITLNSISNYNEGKDEVTSLREKEEIGTIGVQEESKIATTTQTIINNDNGTIKNVKILGRIPFKGNKKITGEELGTTITTALKSEISVKNDNVKYTVYYSEKEEATEDLNNASNEWKEQIENIEKIKSYLIVINNEEIGQGEEIELEYNMEIPEKLNHNEAAYSAYAVYYDSESQEKQEAIGATVGLTTGVGPVIEAKIENNGNEEVVTEQIVKYKLIVKNTGTTVAENVVAKVNVPDNAVYTEYKKIEGLGTGYEYVDNETIKEVSLELGNIEAGATATKEFTLKMKNVGEAEVIAKVSSTSLSTISQSSVKNTVKQGYIDIEYIEDTSDYIVGEENTLAMKLENIASNDFNNVIVKIQLPSNVEYKNAVLYDYNYANDDESKVSYDSNSRIVTINLGKFNTTNNITQPGIAYVDLTITPNSVENISINTNIKIDNTMTQNFSYTNGVEKNEAEVNISSSVSEGYINSDKSIVFGVTIKNTGDINLYTNIGMDFTNNLEYVKTVYDGIEDTSGEELYFNISAGETKYIQIYTSAGIENMSKEEENMMAKFKIQKVNYEKQFNYIVTNTDYNSDEYEEVQYKISGNAWYDANKDGEMGLDEGKMQGIPVKAINIETGKIATDVEGKEITTITGENGTYTLLDLSRGNYRVIFEYDTGKYSLSTYKKDGLEETKNSDVVSGMYEGKEIATTDIISIEDNSIANVNIGLTQKTIFDLSLNKTVSKITMQNAKETKTIQSNSKLAKVDLDGKYINNTNIVVEYNITVRNEGNIAGYANKIADYIPEEFSFSTELNKDWYIEGDKIQNASLSKEIINPGEEKIVTLVLTKKMNENENGIVNNTAEIVESYNQYGINDIDSTAGNREQGEDDISGADVILGIKTGGPVMYIALTITIMAIIVVGAYEINRRVLKKI